MKTLFRSWVLRGLALMLFASAAFAQERVPFRQEELDQMLAPIALYPDPLLSQILMASTYPLEVVQAARWSRANPGLKGQQAVNAVEPMDWDPSVKSLTAFPQVLSMMDEKLEWTERLGEAFLAMQEDVMGTIQGLRRRAEAAGNLRSGEQMRVVRQADLIAIEPAAPEVVYVPYYSPLVVYGSWWWPAFPPVYWAPPPAYAVAPVYQPAFLWGSGIFISAGFFFGHFDWPHRHVQIVHLNHYRSNPRSVHARSEWRHDPVHRRGVPFRSVDARRRFEQSQAIADARGDRVRDAARPGWRVDGERSADIRQRRREERRTAAAERPAGRISEAGAVSGGRLPLAPAGRNESVQPRGLATPAETRRSESGARAVPSLPQAPDLDAGPRDKRRSQREARDSQPQRTGRSAVAPSSGSLPDRRPWQGNERRVAGPVPAARAEVPSVAAAGTRSDPRAISQGARVEARRHASEAGVPARGSAPAAGPPPARRVEAPERHAAPRARGGDPHRERAVNREGGRRS